MKLTKVLLCALLVLCMALCLVACGGEEKTSDDNGDESDESTVSVNTESDVVSDEESETSKEEPQTSKFTVTVVDADGNAVSGVMVQICKDSCIPAMTNASGEAVFNAEITDGYKLSVMSCPAGYTYEGEAEVYLEAGATEYTLTLTKAE